MRGALLMYPINPKLTNYVQSLARPDRFYKRVKNELITTENDRVSCTS